MSTLNLIKEVGYKITQNIEISACIVSLLYKCYIFSRFELSVYRALNSLYAK